MKKRVDFEMADHTIKMLEERYENTCTGEFITGITIMIEGKLKEMMDVLRKRSENQPTDAELIYEMLMLGIETWSKNEKK